MRYLKKVKKVIILELLLLGIMGGFIFHHNKTEMETFQAVNQDFIKWVDFKVSYEALCKAYEIDVDTYRQKIHLNWIELLAYVGARHGGEFGSGVCQELEGLKADLCGGDTTLEKLTEDMKYYDYYLDAYTAVLGGMVGEYEIETVSETGKSSYQKAYGLKGYSPIAKGFAYSDFDDFGASRSFGYKREHLGHDMMGQIGTPIVATESGYVECLGWNQYGGWRIGIRSFDQKRYYYYAHLRQNFPYSKSLKEGSVVTAGEVIGYMGHTGYSTKENVNNIDTVHLHFGMQLIFDESQKNGNGEIWIDCYALIRFLQQHRSETKKIEESKEWVRMYQMKDPLVEQYINQ